MVIRFIPRVSPEENSGFKDFTCSKCEYSPYIHVHPVWLHDIASQLTRKHVILLVVFLARSKMQSPADWNTLIMCSMWLDVVTINIIVEIDLATHMEWVINTNCQLLNSKE